MISHISADGLENFSFQLSPAIEMPVGHRSFLWDAGAEYSMGGSVSLRGQFIPPAHEYLYLDGIVSYNFQPSQDQGSMLSLFSAGVGLGLNLRIGSIYSLQVGAESGGAIGLFPGTGAAGNPYAALNAAFAWDFSPTFSLSLGAGYSFYLGYDDTTRSFTDLYQGVNATVGTVFRFDSGGERTKIEIADPDFDPVFPVFYSHYDQNSLGRVTIRNGENSPVYDVKVYFYLPQYMEQPKLSAELPVLGRGAESRVDLNALFNNSILQLTESAKASVEIMVEYTYLGKRFVRRSPHTLRILDRNSMTWDDDRKAVSFVTSRDPTVLLFSKNTAGLIGDYDRSPVNKNLRIAMGIFEALRLYGMNYVIDPDSSYIEASKNQEFLDYLQFPSQSLTYRAGDCDDLSILYSALLESVNIKTAFITIPAHIYMAFSLGITETEAKREFTHTDDLIFMDGEAWVPVEVTLVNDGFMKAWKTGAREWREATARNVSAFYPVRNAWRIYEPVSFNSVALPLLFPSTDSIVESYRRNLQEFVDQEVEEKAGYYLDRIQTRGESASLRNKLGILYARFGLYEEAEKHFLRASALDSRNPAPMVNLGNIYYLREEMEKALEWYERAAVHDAGNDTILAGIARTRYELEQFEQARRDYARLVEMNPEMASEYAYLGEQTEIFARASAAQDKGKTYWKDEELDTE